MATVRYFIFLSLLATPAFGQLNKAFSLSDSLSEVSGITTDGEYVWMINDSGNEPLLFEFLGEKFMGAYPVNAPNTDWEAMTRDLEGNLYIGDIGNNNNDRERRQIYMIRRADIDHLYDTLKPIRIDIYTDRLLPPSPLHLDYDWESLIYYGGHLYTFSKNRRKPFDGTIINYQLLHLNDDSDTCTALDSAQYGQLIRESYWITDAALSNDRRHLFLLSSDVVIGYLDFPRNCFFEGYRITIPLGHFSQKESITAWNDSTLLIADEKNPLLGGGNVYLLNISEQLEEYRRKRENEVAVESKVIDSVLSFTVTPLVTSEVTVEIYSQDGKLALLENPGAAAAGEVSSYTINTSSLPVDYYVLNIRTGRIPHGYFIRKPAPSVPTDDQGSSDQER